MLASELVVGKIYKTFYYETARAIVQEEICSSIPDNIYGISKETWDSELSLVKVEGRSTTTGCARVRGVPDYRGFSWSIPCCTIREEAQF